MAAITALPTREGIEILNSELINGVKKFVLVGRTEFSYAQLDNLLNSSDLTLSQIQPYIFAELDIESAIYDQNGVLTFHLSLPYDTDYSKYIYAVGLLYINDTVKKLVSIAKTPKVAKIAGVGGSFTYKVAVTGSVGAVVFKQQDYVTTSELEYVIDFQNLSILALSSALTDLTNRLIEKEVITNG